MNKDITIRAKIITWICTDLDAIKLITCSGIGIDSAYIDGELDLSFTTINFPIRFENCLLPKGMNIREAEMGTIYIINSLTGPINNRKD